MPRTRVICVRLTEEYEAILDKLQERWATEDLSDTLRHAIEEAQGVGWRRCCVCRKGLGIARGVNGPIDGHCPEHYEEAMREAEGWIPPEPKAGE